mmetsp:Transcript_26502/g.61813  ORF Transcript_26502/g.61813 Transcript_26502/m.61813 type:complete len:242 (+) Transcript_26502:1104-1829(+)
MRRFAAVTGEARVSLSTVASRDVAASSHEHTCLEPDLASHRSAKAVFWWCEGIRSHWLPRPFSTTRFCPAAINVHPACRSGSRLARRECMRGSGGCSYSSYSCSCRLQARLPCRRRQRRVFPRRGDAVCARRVEERGRRAGELHPWTSRFGRACAGVAIDLHAQRGPRQMLPPDHLPISAARRFRGHREKVAGGGRDRRQVASTQWKPHSASAAHGPTASSRRGCRGGDGPKHRIEQYLLG